MRPIYGFIMHAENVQTERLQAPKAQAARTKKATKEVVKNMSNAGKVLRKLLIQIEIAGWVEFGVYLILICQFVIRLRFCVRARASLGLCTP